MSFTSGDLALHKVLWLQKHFWMVTDDYDQWIHDHRPTPVFLPGILWTEQPGRLQSIGSQRIGHDWVTNTFTSLLQWNDHLERQQEDGNWKPRRESQRKPNLLALWYWTTSLQSCEKINFCCLSHPACGTLLRSSQQQTKLTKTINSCLCRNN